MAAKQIVAMGGGGFSMEPDNLLLDAYVYTLTGKTKPKATFIPTASYDSQQYGYRFLKHWKKLTRSVSILQMVDEGERPGFDAGELRRSRPALLRKP